jgi:hypothetical protein
VVRAGLGALAFAQAAPGERPWPLLTQGAAEICCALLLRIYFDPPFRQTLGGSAFPIFFYALAWSAVVWMRRVWSLAEEGDEPPPYSRLMAFGIGLGSGGRTLLGILWHVGFVAPSLICGGFVLFGLAAELPPRP